MKKTEYQLEWNKYGDNWYFGAFVTTITQAKKELQSLRFRAEDGLKWRVVKQTVEKEILDL